MAKTYSEKLQDPKWQRKRLEIFQRDDFKCIECGDHTKTLHVHHVQYIKGVEPWEYLSEYLETLCCDCHSKEHDLIPKSQPERKQEHKAIRQHGDSTETAIQTHIDILMLRLSKGVPADLESEILKNIMFLQNKRREYKNGR